MGTRSELADALAGILPDTFKIIDSPRKISTLDPTVRAAVQLVRQRIEPNPTNPLGDLLQTFLIWVIEPSTNADTAEDRLDEALAIVIRALRSVKWIVWTQANRDEYDDARYHAYSITAQVSAELEQES